MDKVVGAIGVMIFAVAAFVILGLILSLPVMWLWNDCLVPAVTILKPVGWLQAWGISILCSFLFKPSISKD